MTKHKVSVIIPVFNRPSRLKEAIMSVLLQSYGNIEIIIVDDGSTDLTVQVVDELATKWPDTIRVFKQDNSGPGVARQLGTCKSTGDYIQYLDSDDLLLPDKFTIQVNAFQRNPEAGIAYGISYQADYSRNPPVISGPIRATGHELEYLFPRLLNERWWTTSSPLYRRSTIDLIGPWKDLINEEDWEFDARAGRLKTKLKWTPTGVSIRRINVAGDHLSHGGSTDKRKISARVISKKLLYIYAKGLGIASCQQEMKMFSRECFLLARQCAEASLDKESQEMFVLARQAAGKYGKFRFDFIIYSLSGRFLGWKRTGTLASKMRNMLK
jgi:glycosyltransferase involved in cell wall biosynthesis